MNQKRQELLRRVEQAGLEEGDLKLIRALFESYAYITELIDDKVTVHGSRSWRSYFQMLRGCVGDRLNRR